MTRQNFLRKGFFAILFVLLVSVSGCGAIGNDSQITQMNQAFLPDATDGAAASSKEKPASPADGDSIASEEKQMEERDALVSGNDKNSSSRNSNSNANSYHNSDGNAPDKSGKNDNKISKNGDRGSDKNSGTNNDSNSTASNEGSKSGNKNNSKVHKNTAKPSPTKKPQPIPTPVAEFCTISIDCKTILKNMDKLNSAKQSFVPENGIILPEISVKLQQGDTVFDILSRVCREREIHMEASYTPLYGTYYVEGIHQLYEFDCGKDMSGWKYFVNGVSVNYSCSKYEVKAGDTICWSYTCDGGKDLEKTDE